MRRVILVIGAIFAWLQLYPPVNLWARPIYVPAEYPDIASAIDATATGDEICLGRGVYRGNFTLKPKTRLSGEDAAGTILIPAERSSQPVIIAGDGCIIENLTFTQTAAGAPAALLVKSGLSLIRRNIFTGNHSPAIAIEGMNTQARIEDNQITDNRGVGILLGFSSSFILNNRINSNSGTGVSVMNASAIIQGNQISYNLESGVSIMATMAPQNMLAAMPAMGQMNQAQPVAVQPQIRDNELLDNLGPAIICDKVSPFITGNTIRGKVKPPLLLFASNAIIRENKFTTGGIPAIQSNNGGSPVIEENIISGSRRFPILGGKESLIRNNKIVNDWMPGFAATDWLTQPKTAPTPESPASGAPGS